MRPPTSRGRGARALAALAVAVAAVAVLAAPSVAGAQESDYDLKVVVPKPRVAPTNPDGTPAPATDPNVVDSAPILRVITGGRVGLTAKDFLLKLSDARPPVQPIEATKSVVYRESDEPMAMVILVQGNFRWIGNETFTDPNDPEAGSIYDGAYKGLGPAIDVLAKAGPSGSKAALLVYAEGKIIPKQALGDAAGVSASSLGAQQDYQEFISKPLALGLTEAWKVLANQPDHRKILVIFGDGQDDKEDISAEIKKAVGDLKASGVEVYTVFYSAMPEDGPVGQQNMAKIGYTEHMTATSRDNFASLADNISEGIGAKYYVDFPGDKVTWDGAEHEFTLVVSNVDKDPKTLTLPTLAKKRAAESSLWWVWVLVAVLVVAIIVAVVIVKRRAVEMPMEAPPPPMPAGPLKTVMLGIGGNEDSMPIVGWVVPLAGPNQYQTFKLGQGATRVGTGGGAHIVVGDSFMSAEHAEIVCSANGFVINDLGSTNGTYVNSRRISSHELVDNDVFKLGKTDFKFKSIN